MQFKQWWRVRIMGEPAEPVPPSGYMTLIPLNGETCSAVSDAANIGVIYHCIFCCPIACCIAPDGEGLLAADARLKPQRKLLFFSCMVSVPDPPSTFI